MDSRRAESFSDGVFAVAITVLVFNLLPIARAGITLKDLRRSQVLVPPRCGSAARS
jgi:uncharacterized membrane protein